MGPHRYRQSYYKCLNYPYDFVLDFQHIHRLLGICFSTDGSVVLHLMFQRAGLNVVKCFRVILKCSEADQNIDDRTPSSYYAQMGVPCEAEAGFSS